MNLGHILRTILFTILIFTLTVPHTTSRAETPSPPGTIQENTLDNEPEQDIPGSRVAVSVSSDLVMLQVLVTDKKGNVITGLSPENFTIYEDKVKQEIQNLSQIEANITAVMLIEQTRRGSYSLNQHFIDQIDNIMFNFVRRLQQGDWVGVIGFDIRPTILCDFTLDHQKVLDTMKIFRVPAITESNLFDAIIDTLDRTQEMEGKVAVLLVSTGFNSFSAHTYDDVLNACKQANASVYSISMGQYYRLLLESRGYSSGESSLEYQMADSHLRYISEYTGGAAYFPRHDSELPAITANISELLRNQYSIGYVSSNTKKDGKFRKIKVEVNANMMHDGKPVKFKVTTRKGYIPRPD